MAMVLGNYGQRAAFPFGAPIKQKQEEQTFTPSRAFPAAIQTQAADYDTIMGGYKNLLNTRTSPSLMQNYASLRAPTPIENISPITTAYSQSSDTGRSLEGLRNLSETGGLSEDEIGELRARAVSPIRSIYSSAQRELDRSRALSGGYSPNYGAASSRMARELSEQIGGATTDVNAQIAQMRQSGRLAAAPQYAQVAGQEASRRTAIEQANTEAMNRALELNAARRMESQRFGREGQLESLAGQERLLGVERGRESEALSGMRSLYGTAPALASTYGSQALQTESLARSTPEIRKRRRTAPPGIRFNR